MCYYIFTIAVKASDLRKGAVNVSLCTLSSLTNGIRLKKRLQSEERHVYIRPGEIRWIAFGVNLGSEIDGKGVSFTRPGFVVHVFGSFLALVIPAFQPR